MELRGAIFALLIAGVSISASAKAQTRPPVQPPVRPVTPALSAPVTISTVGHIRGIVYDSLLMKPVSHATVTLMSNARTVVADMGGRYAFDSVAAGMQTVVFSSPQTDSLGLGTLGNSVTVVGGETADLTLSTPSLRSLWAARCGDGSRVGADSGIVWGTVHDAATDAAANGGSVAVYWYDLNAGVASGMRFNQRRRQVFADANGVYFACGLPVDVRVEAEGLSSDAASARASITIGPRRLYRQDLLVSTDMAVPENLTGRAADSAMKALPRGHATLRGFVHDDKGAPMDNANVLISAADTSVRTDAQGRFTLGNQPAGTQMMQVRRVGVTPVIRTVELRPNQNTEVDVLLTRSTTLATTNIVAKSARRLEYDDRRARNLGTAIDSAVLNHRSEFYSALQDVPLLQIQVGSNGKKTLALRALASRARCAPRIFIDGLPSVLDAVELLPPSSFRAIEVIPDQEVPLKYMGKCGVVLVWTTKTKW